jgi:NitT/TauT family transport system substrate-binding protein
MKTVQKLLGSALAVTLLLAGCSAQQKAPEPTATQTPSGTQATPKEKIKVNVAVGGKSSIIYLPPAYAEYNGYFEAEGIEFKVEDVKGGAQAAQALVSGQVDIASMAVEHAVKSKAQGVDLVMLVLYTRYPAITLVVDSKLKEKVKTVADLKGMKVGVTSIGSATHKAMLSLMEKFGLKTTDIEIVGVGTSGAPAAIQSGKVQAVFGLDPWVTQMINAGQAYSLWDLRTQKDTVALYGGDYPFVGLVTRREVLQKNPEMVQRVVNAVVKANKFIASNSAEIISAKLPTEIKGDDEKLYAASLKANLEAFSPDGMASEAGLKLVIDSLKAEKVIPDTMTINPSDVFDSSFLKKAP